MLKISNIRQDVGDDEAGLPDLCARLLGCEASDFRQFRILRKSLDIRDKRRLQHVYTLGVALDGEASFPERRGSVLIAHFKDTSFQEPTSGSEPLPHRPVIVGAGPAGLFAGYLLAKHGYAPLLLERGRAVPQRVRDVRAFDAGGDFNPESNYLYGEGGAGTFSDGKLTCRSTGADADEVLRIFAKHKGKPSILYESRPHLGSNRLPAVVKDLRQQILAWGGEVRFDCRVDDFDCDSNGIRGVVTSQGRLDATVVLLAIGHSARDTYDVLLRRNVAIQPKPFQMGVRIEHPQANVTLAQYGRSPQARLLGPADYSMNVRVGDRELFTFCMCAGGYVMPSISSPGHFCTNGMSRSWHESPYANSGLVVTIDPNTLKGAEGNPLVGIHYQAAIEQRAYALGGDLYLCPIQRAQDFLNERRSSPTPPSSYPRGLISTNLWEILPLDVARWLQQGLPAMDRQWRGLFLRDATLVGPEARGSCPVRLPRDPQTRESTGTPGLYPIGEGAGYAGGIVSAAMDGLRTARTVIQRFRPLKA